MKVTLSQQHLDDCRRMIAEARSIVITSHKSPDGDAIGSALAMHHFLKNMGQNVITILPDEVPDFLQWLPGYEEIIFFNQQKERAGTIIRDADLIFSLDYNQLSRVGEDMEKALIDAKGEFIMIDHHQLPGSYPKVTFSDTSACSTCEMVHSFIVQLGYKTFIDVNAGTCIYTGIMTDSGSFRFHTVSQGTHYIAGELIALGVDHAEIHRNVYDTNLMDKLRLIGYALSEKLVVLHDCSTAFISLSKEELERFNYKPGDTEGLVNQALSIKGVKLAAFFREGNNEVKCSFRSKGSFDVNAFSRKYWNGGGHMNAAGGASIASLDDILHKFRALAHELKNEINPS